MNAHERVKATIHEEIPDKISLFASTSLSLGSKGAIFQKLIDRGMCRRLDVPTHKPSFSPPESMNLYLKDVAYTVRHYYSDGNWQLKHTYETPIGTIEAIAAKNLDLGVRGDNFQSHFIKEPRDWLVINFIFQKLLDNLQPNHKEIQRVKEELGGEGYVIGLVERTPFQRGWIEFASIERLVVDCKNQPDEFLAFLELQYAYHQKIAEFAAECPTDLILVDDNITNVISPTYYEQYCIPFYKLYCDQIKSVNKKLAVHHDGLLHHLKDQIAKAPFEVIDSLTAPPSGDVPLADARKEWPGKIAFINIPPHLVYKEDSELRDEYTKIIDAWGSDMMAFTHVEYLPYDRIEPHLSAILDVCGY